MAEEFDKTCVDSSMQETPPRYTHSDITEQCDSPQPCIQRGLTTQGIGSCCDTQEVTLSDDQLQSALCTVDDSTNIVQDSTQNKVVESQVANNKRRDLNGAAQVLSSFPQLPTTIPSVVVSDTTAVEKEQCKKASQDKACMDNQQSSGTRNPKIQHICESSGSLDSNSGEILLGESNEHMLLSPRRSCDSAYSSSLDNGGSMDNQQDDRGISFSVEAGDFSGANASSAEDSPSHKIHCSTLTVGVLRKNSPSPFSSSSSIASDMETSSKGDDILSNSTLSVHDSMQQRKNSSSSSCSLRSSLSFEESEEDFVSSDENTINTNRRHSKVKALKAWTKVRRMVIWSPFMQSFKKKYPWVQLAGHAGNFQPGEEGCILKKFVEREAECLSGLTSDPNLQDFSPTFHGIVEVQGEKYTRMQDLLLPFDCPSLMDCKMGIRTYLEDELVKAKVKPRLRHDMYQKMVEVSPDEPTEEERKQSAVTKPRYMQWREHISSTSNLGFRIEGIKKSDKDPSKDYKLTKTRAQVISAFKYFIDGNIAVLRKYMERLNHMREALGKSDFFHSHEVIGSSLLFVHDNTGEANVWMIDFGKTTRLPNSQKLDHRSDWVEGNREDGYLFGMDNMLSLFQAILQETTTTPSGQNSLPADDVTANSPRSNRRALRRQDARNSASEIGVDNRTT